VIVRLHPLALLLAVVVGAVALVGGVVLLTAPEGAVSAASTSGLGPQGRVPQFKVECAWSHAAPDDPIVHPGYPGRSHLHDFFGNVATDADSSATELVEHDTTCQNKLDTAAYWAPALLREGVPVTPSGSVAYYRPGPGTDLESVHPYPPGLMMIAGDPAATEPQAPAIAAWHCGASPILSAAPPSCPRTAPLGVRIAFPDCWDGEHLDSHDHRAHLATAVRGRCPDSHPVAIPQLVFEVHYPLTGDPTGLELASGGVHGVHADFLNTWDQAALEREVRVCLNGGKVCGVVSNRATG
jgi:Domain of unknown function (DUF1996)